MNDSVEHYLVPFADLPKLRDLVHVVLSALPDDVLRDFLGDDTFRITLEDYTPERGWTMFMELPQVGSVSRCVVLRERLEEAPEGFAKYVIAHEFAHAFLRNGGWGTITDKEEAADALAASWGFERPRQWWRWRAPSR